MNYNIKRSIIKEHVKNQYVIHIHYICIISICKDYGDPDIDNIINLDIIKKTDINTVYYDNLLLSHINDFEIPLGMKISYESKNILKYDEAYKYIIFIHLHNVEEYHKEFNIIKYVNTKEEVVSMILEDLDNNKCNSIYYYIFELYHEYYILHLQNIEQYKLLVPNLVDKWFMLNTDTTWAASTCWITHYEENFIVKIYENKINEEQFTNDVNYIYDILS